MTVRIVLTNGMVVKGRKVEVPITPSKAALYGLLKAPTELVALINVLWYKVLDAEVEGRKIKEIHIPLTSILYMYEE